MLSIITVLFWSLLTAEYVLSQFLSPPPSLTSISSDSGYTVRYKEVPPGICEQRADLKSISGYVDVSADQHIFFWFFEARNQDPTTAPLTTWINGGPGTSSMVGLFQEMGPCSIDSNGEVLNNPYSWTNASNLLFIDQPVQTGFSYSTTTPGYVNPANGYIIASQNGICPSQGVTDSTCGTYSNPNDLNEIPVSTSAAAPAFYATLQGFMGAFPQYAREGFHFATESYGGRYGPVFSEYIEAQNAKQAAGTKNISLKTLTIVNGWMNPIVQYAAYYNFTVDPGNTYDYKPYNDSAASELYSLVYGSGACVDQLENCAATGTNSVCAAADNYCLQVEGFFDTITGRDEDDIRELEPDPYPPENYVRYLNTPAVQAAIGAFVNYTEQSLAVAYNFNTTGDDGRIDGTTTDVLTLVENGVAVTMLYGDADYNSNWLGGEAVYDSISVPGYSTPGYVDISTSDKIVHGQAKQSGFFTFARIYESGHEIPYYQPLTALALFERAISGYDIATGEQKVDREYVTVGSAKSTYREGNATMKFAVVQDGQLELLDPGNDTLVHENDRTLHPVMNPGKKLLAEDANNTNLDVGKLALMNASTSTNTLDGLRKSGKLTIPIHMRKRARKMRRGT
ncbi:putative carboxypeptidase 2 [Usnea florida]